MTSPLGTNDTGNPNLSSQASHPVAPVNGTLVPREVLSSLDSRQALAPLPPGLSANPNPLTLLKALQRRLVLALTVGFIVAAAGGTAAWFLSPPPKLTARTMIFVAQKQPVILNNVEGGFENRGNAYMHNQASLIKSPFVLRQVLRDPEVLKLRMVQQWQAENIDPEQGLEEIIKIDFPGTELLRISISGDNQKELETLVRAVARSFMQEVVGASPKKRQDHLDKLKNVKKRLGKDLVDLEIRMKPIEDAIGVGDREALATQQKMEVNNLNAAQQEYVRVRAERRKLQVELGLPEKGGPDWESFAAAMSALPGPIPPMNFAIVNLLHGQPTALPFSPPNIAHAAIDPKALELQIDKDKTSAALRFYIRDLEVKIEKIREETVSEQAFLKLSARHRKALAEAKKGLEGHREKLRPELAAEMRKQVEAAEQAHWSQSFSKYATLRRLENILANEVVRLDAFLRQFNRTAVKAGRFEEEHKQLRKFLEQAEGQIRKMELEEEAPERVRWLGQEMDKAGTLKDGDVSISVPDAKKMRLMATLAASLAPLGLILLGFALLEFRTRKIHSPDDVVQGLGIRLVGTVPDLTYHRSWLRWLRPSGGTPPYAQHLLTESVDAARTLVLHVSRTETLQIVMITSALSGEGKTSLASHLAASLARSGRRTLLIDCDMRNPALHLLFGLERGPGLSELLRGETDIPSVLRPTDINNLWLVSAGQSDGASLQALAQDGIGPIFQQLRQQYDFIIVDSCPVLPVADSLLVGQHVDAVIFSLLREVSRLPKVYAACQRLVVLGIRMLGAVVNGTRDDLAVGDYHYISPDLDT
jgi:capsular exopolysaccharide synthesis family protein